MDCSETFATRNFSFFSSFLLVFICLGNAHVTQTPNNKWAIFTNVEIKDTLNELEVKTIQGHSTVTFIFQLRLFLRLQWRRYISFTFENVENLLICILKDLNYDDDESELDKFFDILSY